MPAAAALLVEELAPAIGRMAVGHMAHSALSAAQQSRQQQ